MLMLGDLERVIISSFISLCFLRKESKCIIAGRQHKQTTWHGLLFRVVNCLASTLPISTIFRVIFAIFTLPSIHGG